MNNQINKKLNFVSKENEYAPFVWIISIHSTQFYNWVSNLLFYIELQLWYTNKPIECYN